MTVRLFARLRDIVGTGEIRCDVPSVATVRDVWRGLTDSHPALAPFGGAISAAVNADYAKFDRTLAPGDEVAFLPPVSGG
ncbi:MAG: molybdopterin converting factor subunit 1 [Vicinamibacterales bacterium]